MTFREEKGAWPGREECAVTCVSWGGDDFCIGLFPAQTLPALLCLAVIFGGLVPVSHTDCHLLF